MSKPVLKLKSYGNYKHDFSLKHYNKLESYICKKCGAIAGYENWSMKRIYLYKMAQYKKSNEREKNKFKSSLKVIERKSSKYDEPSYATLWKKGNECYRINPFTGKILTKRGCLYSGTEMIIKDII